MPRATIIVEVTRPEDVAACEVRTGSRNGLKVSPTDPKTPGAGVASIFGMLRVQTKR